MTLTPKRLAGTAISALCAILAFAGVSAEELVERTIAIVLDLGDDAGVLDLDFSPFDLTEGETRTVNTRDGGTVLLSRRNGETVITTAAGKEIVLPAPPSDSGSPAGHAMTWVENGSSNIDVGMMIDHPAEGLMISSAQALDEATRERIRAALKSAGIEEPVNFMEAGTHNVFIHKSVGEGPDGEVRIIREERVIKIEDKH
ncbi:MAG: hypothetical protein MUP90_07910 [Gammaproteobacteria bacterium]|nr:hypothetical protein [Gammaproteobacteria bacterium]